MSSRDLVDRFQKAFNDPDKVKADEYQKIIETNASKASENVERLTISLLGLVMVFILVIQGAVDKNIDLGPLKITNLKIVLILIPVFVSYIHYDLVTTLAKFDRLSVMYKAIVKQRHNPIHEHRLTKYFLSSPTFYEYKYLSSDGVAHKLQSCIWILQFFSITIFIPLGFQTFAFWQLTPTLYREYSILLGASLIISTLFSLQSFFTIFALLRETSEK